MTHLTPEELADAADGSLDPARAPHVGRCERCQAQVAALAALLQEAAQDPVPEPSPLFWEHFSARVRRAVADDDRLTAGRPGWSRHWPALVPLGALAVLVAAVVATVAGRPGFPNPPVAPASSLADPAGHPAADVPTDAAGWDVVIDLVGPLDWDAAGEAGLVVAPGDTELAVLDLDADERRELTRLLEGELRRSKS